MTDIKNEVVTRHIGLAAFYRYCLGDKAHIATTLAGKSPAFSFDDSNKQCPDLEKAFFAEGGAAVGNALALCECLKAINITRSIANREGQWNGEEL